MLIRHLLPESHLDLEIVSWRPGATLADLAATISPGAHCPSVWVDGRMVPARTALDHSGLMAGSTVSLHAVPVDPSGDRRAGPSAVTHGRSQSASDPVATVPRHRTGRRPLPDGPQPVRLPAPEPPPPTITPIGVVAMVVSIIGAGVMVAVLGSWTYAAFAVVGPLMMLANTADSRFRRRRVRRRYARQLRKELVRLDSDLEAEARAERARRAVVYPGGVAAAQIAAAQPPRCWERRAHDVDAHCVRVGHGAGLWQPQLDGDPAITPDEVRALVEARRLLPDTPIGVAVRPGRPIAIVGSGEGARALARSVVTQLAAVHGPVDLALAAVVSGETAGHWDWLAWLPHTIDPDGRRSLALGGSCAEDLAASLTAPPGGLAVVVIDDPEGLCARRSAARSLLRASADQARHIACVTLLGPGDPVPAACSVVLRVADDGSLTDDGSASQGRATAGPAVAEQMSLDTATDLARRLARFDDPELEHDGRMLPPSVRIPPLLGVEGATARALVERWRSAGADPSPSAPIGMAADGPLVLDLLADGPHALVVGTTGSGKSEALRSLVLGLATTQSPDHLVFVLVDFKGGSAFDACVELPHTVGLVTDLDDHLAARALRCLEAELRHREERFRSCGAADLRQFRRTDRSGVPLPRLAIVVDEFAVLAATIPAFVDALVDVAQRGRSLGVHLVLATQRPGGAVTPAIRANVGLSMALRVQSADDSRDVIGSPVAADLPRHVPGRAVIRFGPGDLVPVQVACSSLPPATGSAPVSVHRLGIAHGVRGPAVDIVRAPSGTAVPETDLSVLAAKLSEAWQSMERPAPRRPWPDPLPDGVTWPPPIDPGDQTRSPTGLVLGLADDPDRQRVIPFRWDIDAGPLLGVGLPGSGTLTLAGTVALAAATRWTPDSCHIHVLDATGSDLVALSGLPHVGAVVTSAQLERQRRLVRSVAAELDARRSGAPRAVRRVVVVHGVSALQTRWEEAGHLELWALLMEVVAEGARLGIHVCCTAESSAVQHRLVAACGQRLVFRLGDPADQATFGVPAGFRPRLPPGRAITSLPGGVPTVVQVASQNDGLAAAVARISGATSVRQEAPDGQPPWVGVLPEQVKANELATQPGGPTMARMHADGSITLPIGLADRDLTTATLQLPAGAHALVSGPPGSGRSTALASIAAAARPLGHLRVVVVTTSAGPTWPATAQVIGPDDGLLDTLSDQDGPILVLVDDADRTADDHPALTKLALDRRPDRHLVAAGRSDRLRSRYGHWTRELRADGIGLLLTPDPDLDGDLLGAKLPRRPPVAMVPGRAWLTGSGRGSNGYVQLVRCIDDGRPPLDTY